MCAMAEKDTGGKAKGVDVDGVLHNDGAMPSRFKYYIRPADE